MLNFPTNAGKLNSARYGARSGTIGAYCTYSNTKLAACSSKRETVSDTPNSELICRRFRMLFKHVGEECVSAYLNVKLGPFDFPSVFSQDSTGECS